MARNMKADLRQRASIGRDVSSCGKVLTQSLHPCPIPAMEATDTPSTSSGGKDRASISNGTEESFESLRSDHLDMNHIHLSLGQYMWGAHFVALPSVGLLLYGLVKLVAVKLLKRLGMVNEPSADKLSYMAGQMLLETSCIINLSHVRSVNEDEEIAEFVWPSLPFIVDANASCACRVGMLQVEVNLKTKQVVRAIVIMQTRTLELPMCDVVVVLAHVISLTQHPKIHAYANWGIDPKQREHQSAINPYFQKMSIVTTVYNHFGFSNFPEIMGFLYDESTELAVANTIKQALITPTPAHSHIRALMKHSRLVKFIAHLRGPWFQVFKQEKAEFPDNISAESHLLGTVVHSIDHAMFCQNINPWTFAAITPSPEYATMKKAQEVVRFALSDDLPGTAFARYFKHAPMRFYQEIYKRARNIDAEFADLMQTCIIK